MQPGAKHAKYDVEVLTTDDLWSRYGSKLPDRNQTVVQQSSRWRRLGVCSAGMLFSVTLHVLLFGTMLLGTAGRPPMKLKPLLEGAATSSQNNNVSEVVSVLLLLNNHSITPPDQPPDESAYETPPVLEQATKQALLVSSMDAVTTPTLSGSSDGKDENATTAEATGNEAGRALLFGRYMGQVKARIQRAWDYPVNVGVARFDCKVQIKQNSKGEVQEITLQRCGDDPAWQMSLVQAIQRASPLSAPPSDAVFSEVIGLSFTAQVPLSLVVPR